MFASQKTPMSTKVSEASIDARTSEIKLQPPTPNSNCSFLVDLADIQTMKQNLQDLLISFRSGKLKAFGTTSSIEQMENIRNMQGKLARLHFGLDRKVSYDDIEDSAESLEMQKRNMTTLLEKLDDVSVSMKSFNIRSSPPKNSTTVFKNYNS